MYADSGHGEWASAGKIFGSAWMEMKSQPRERKARWGISPPVHPRNGNGKAIRTGDSGPGELFDVTSPGLAGALTRWLYTGPLYGSAAGNNWRAPAWPLQ
jgi:hypothetical protein